MNTQNPYLELSQARGNMYQFFSTIYLREPSKDFIKKILEREFINNLSEIFKKGAKCLKNFAETFDGKLEQYDALVVEYNSLFNVPLEQYVAPYESAYREGLLYIHAVEVKKFYEANGFSISEDYKDLPDHVGLELEFMGHLCERGDLEAQKKFFEDHLIKWVPNLCEEIIKKSESDFYKGIARITKEFLEMEKGLF
ncbi:MAG: molecular chaperone [Methanosarcinales archaeon]